jgi:flagellin
MERLATGKQNANAGDRSSYVAMSDTFRLDFVGTKAGIKGASVAMGYLETGMRVLDSASSLLSRLQELAVLGANNTNTVQDHEAINLEAEALGDEFNRLMTTSAYKGKNVFVDNASSEYVSVGGRNAEMTFGIGKISYTELYNASNERTIAYTGGPNNTAKFHLQHLPSDAVQSAPVDIANIEAGVRYELLDYDTLDATGEKDALATAFGLASRNDLEIGKIYTAAADDVNIGDASGSFKGRIIDSAAGTTFSTLQSGSRYEISDITSINNNDDKDALIAASDLTSRDQIVNGVQFTATSTVATIDAGTFVGKILTATSVLTSDIEAVQAKVNTARVQAGSQYAALESAVDYTTDLTAQYELGFNTVNDVNFSMETAHLAKNQILQQAATAMLAQANQGQQSLLQLIQG